MPAIRVNRTALINSIAGRRELDIHPRFVSDGRGQSLCTRRGVRWKYGYRVGEGQILILYVKVRTTYLPAFVLGETYRSAGGMYFYFPSRFVPASCRKWYRVRQTIWEALGLPIGRFRSGVTYMSPSAIMTSGNISSPVIRIV